MIKALVKSFSSQKTWKKLQIIRRMLESLTYRIKLLCFRTRFTNHTYSSVPLTILISDPQAEAWYDKDWENLPELATLKKGKLRPDARVFNIGAHQGIVACLLADAVGKEGHVIAVDPSPHNIKTISANAISNGFHQIVPVHAAIGQHPGKLRLGSAWVSTRVVDTDKEVGSYEVTAFTVDDLSEKYGQPDVLFIDIEGYECRALKGATKTLSKNPDCFVEVHVGYGLDLFGDSVESLLKFFPTDSYKIYAGLASNRGSIDSQGCYRPIDMDSSLLQSKFFLIALSK